MTDHPMQPTVEQLDAWVIGANQPGTNKFQLGYKCAKKAYAAGADAELEACCEWLDAHLHSTTWSSNLRCDRRPKLPSLKQQALDALSHLEDCAGSAGSVAVSCIEKALESIPDQ